MKTFGNGTSSFGFAVVNAGQRKTNEEPQLVVISTPGSFRITGAVSKALMLSAGDNVTFLNNIAMIDNAIDSKAEELVQFCEENGYAIESDEARAAIHEEFDSWCIAKGIQEFDTKGNPKLIKERLSKNDRLSIVKNDFDNMLEQARNSENAELVAAVTREGVTEDELVEILASCVEGRELPKFSGSKTANPSGLNGVGVGLNFSDSNVWAQLKADLSEDDAKHTNRVFSVDVNNSQMIELFNGRENVTVKILPLASYTDETVKRNTKKDAE